MKTHKRPLIGISSCLLGNKVRYNHGHTQEYWITDELGKYVDFYACCPEMAMGLGSPREELQLYYTEPKNKKLSLRTKFGKQDLTEQAQAAYQEINRQIDGQKLNGFILMKKSPSCGLKNVKTVSDDEQGPVKMLQGLFATNLVQHYPHLPKEESGRLYEAELRENFVKQVFAHFRFSQIERSIASIQNFHKLYKYVLMEHSQTGLMQLGRIVANAENLSVDEVFKQYEVHFFEFMNQVPSVKNRYNTLLHVMGYLKQLISSEDKQQLLELFDDYRQGLQGYMVPLSLLHFLINRYKVTYLLDHYYFQPYPKELKLQKEL